MSPAQFAARLGHPGASLVLDMRRPPRFVESPRILPTAHYCAPDDVAAFAAQHPTRSVLVYCVYGHEASQETAAVLPTSCRPPAPRA